MNKYEKIVPQGMNKPFKVTKRIKRGTTRYTIMFIPDSTEPSKTYELTFDKLIRWVTAIIAVTTVIVCLCISLSIRHKRAVHGPNGYLEQIDTLSETNNTLTNANAALSQQINNLSSKLAVYEIEAARDDEHAEGEDIPSLYPVSGLFIELQDPSADAKKFYGIRKCFYSMQGSQIVATAYGKVVSVVDDAVHGKLVVIDHENGYKTYYRWDGRILRTEEGRYVYKGESIGAAETDDTLLCYEVTRNEIHINPSTVIESEEY